MVFGTELVWASEVELVQTGWKEVNRVIINDLYFRLSVRNDNRVNKERNLKSIIACVAHAWLWLTLFVLLLLLKTLPSFSLALLHSLHAPWPCLWNLLHASLLWPPLLIDFIDNWYNGLVFIPFQLNVHNLPMNECHHILDNNDS